jgi:hypothetical protein
VQIDWQIVAVVLALTAFNLPIIFTALQTRHVDNLSGRLGQALQEKDSAGDPTNATSYSRVTGAVGAVIVGSLFWVVSNITLALAILNPHLLPDLLTGVGKLFLVGAALFLPYAFNQLKSVWQ